MTQQHNQCSEGLRDIAAMRSDDIGFSTLEGTVLYSLLEGVVAGNDMSHMAPEATQLMGSLAAQLRVKVDTDQEAV